MEIRFPSEQDEDIPTIRIDILVDNIKVGHVRLVPHSEFLYEIHITSIVEEYKGQALPIARMVWPFLFQNLKKVEKFIAMIPSQNRLAVALAKRSGMHQEGYIKDSIKINGVFQDQIILTIARGDI